MLTFEGAKVDMYIGASAPLIAWLSTRVRMGVKLALAWNVLGLLSLANVVIRAVLVPFMFISGFFVPLAVSLHVLAIRLGLILVVPRDSG